MNLQMCKNKLRSATPDRTVQEIRSTGHGLALSTACLHEVRKPTPPRGASALGAIKCYGWPTYNKWAHLLPQTNYISLAKATGKLHKQTLIRQLRTISDKISRRYSDLRNLLLGWSGGRNSVVQHSFSTCKAMGGGRHASLTANVSALENLKCAFALSLLWQNYYSSRLGKYSKHIKSPHRSKLGKKNKCCI